MGLLSTAIARSRASHQAAKFERSAVPGRVYYSIEECSQPWGDEPRKREWVFTQSRLGHLKCGPHSPAYVWLNYGPLTVADPGFHIKPMFDKSSGPAPSEADQKRALDAALKALKRAHRDLEKVR